MPLKLRPRAAFLGAFLTGAPPSESSAQWSFTDVSASSGAGVPHDISSTASGQQKETGGVACGDYDNDGWIDLYHLGGNLGSNHLLRNNGDGTFSDVASQAGVALPGTWGAGAAFADWNGDGWLDLFVGSIAPSNYVLFENDGDGTFTNVTASTGVSFTLDTFSASFADTDNDGDLDMVLSHWGEGQGTKHFWRNDGNDASSTNFTAADALFGYQNFRGTPADWGFTYNFADLNSDGWMDFVCASDYITSHVYLNDGDGTFTDFTNTAVINDDNGMGSCIADYDKDGDLDWFVSSIMNSVAMTKNGNRMYRNLGNGTFEDATDHANVRDGQWGWGATFQDFNNDGWLDLYHTNGWQHPQWDFDAARLFVSDGDATFTEMGAALGVADTDQGRGVACFDYDRDGDIDIFVSNCDQPARLYRNDGGNAKHWLDVKLVGPPPNTEQIGARITAVVGGSSQLWELRAGNNFESQDAAEAHFGLGTATDVDTLRVEWRDGSVTTLMDVPADQRLVLSGGGCWPVPAADFSAAPTSGTAPLAVAFTDLSSGSPTTWSWVFGDGGTSSTQNPLHTYTVPGTYDVTLTVTNACSTDTMTRVGHVTVTTPGSSTTITYDDFEAGMGTYTDGGVDMKRYTAGTYAWEGSAAAGIQDNSGKASAFFSTVGYDVRAYATQEVEFHFMAVGMETGEDFWVQYHDGAAWRTVAALVAGTDFVNGAFYQSTVTISSTQYTFPAAAKLRFACDASADNDDVYIDAITWRGLTAGAAGGVRIAAAAERGATAWQTSSTGSGDVVLYQNHPNPAGASTSISFALPFAEHVRLDVYDVAGRRVLELLDERRAAGRHSVEIGTRTLMPGVYFVRLVAGDEVARRKMIVVE
jgi:PKD repeat protein